MPGQRKGFTITGSQTNVEVMNGRAFFNVLIAEPVSDPAEVCPNRRWTATATDVEFETATITMIQPSGSDNVVPKRTFNL